MCDNSNSQGDCQSSGVTVTGVIYKITNNINGKLYVGQTRQKLNNRIKGHKHSKVQRGVDVAIAKYGWENFSVAVIEECPLESLGEREIFWIAELNSKAPNGYNLTDGGEGLVNPSEETRAKMSANRPDISGEKNPNYGKKTPPEVCAKISASNKGKTKGKKRKPLSEEHKAKVSANHTDVSGEKNPNYGKKTPPEVCAKISTANKGKPSPRKGKKHSLETRAKISAAHKGQPSPRKGKKCSPETCAKISAAKKGKKGKPHSPETCAKIAASVKATWARKKLESQNKS